MVDGFQKLRGGAPVKAVAWRPAASAPSPAAAASAPGTAASAK
jgi:membrane fusion protein (multidrug efflux system)